MKKIISIILALALGSAAYAQSALDGLIFSEKNYVGTARTLAMGNAFTALGGDTGAMDLNPASTAVNKGLVTTLTLGCNTSLSYAQGTTPLGSDEPFGYGSNIKTIDNTFVMPNLAVSVSYATPKSVSVKRISIGVALNASNYINDVMYAEGNHIGTSFAGYLAANTTAPYNELVNSNAYYNGVYAWDAILGVQSGMITNMEGANDQYIGITEKYTTSPDGTNIFVGGPLNQKFGKNVIGATKESVFNIAFDIREWIYVGVNMGFTNMNYKNQYYLKETAVLPSDFEVVFNDNGKEVSTKFNSLRYQYTYNAKLNGLYGKLGIIMTPGKIVRIGATIQTPTFTTINENWQVGGETTFEASDFNSSSTSPRGEQKYVLHQPWRTSLGVATVFGKRGLVSVDYETAYFGRMNFSAYDPDSHENYFGETNIDIRQNMGAQHNLRVGAEFKAADWIAVRAGYDLLTNPFKEDYSIKHSASAGLGFSFAGFVFCDIATRALFYPVEYIKPYGDYIFTNGAVDMASPEIRHWQALFSTVATIGFKF